MKKETETPTCEQLEILTAIADRVLMEFRVDTLGLHLKKNDPNRENQERPMLGFVHGSPGTGKSRVIKWIRRLFIEALEWKHGDEFLFVAFQNRVAHAMEGTTIHAGGDIGVGGARSMRLEHTDVDVLYTRNQLLRWIIIDEMSMVPDELLGIFEHHLTDAAARTRYSQRCDGTNRPFGGYNVMGFGDFFQIPPIPSTASLTIPPIEKKTEHATKALDLLWGDGSDALNFFAELTLQKRIDDKWYADMMEECRYGRLSNEAYNFLVGLPTENPGSFRKDGSLECANTNCTKLAEIWKQMAREGKEWNDLQKMECKFCKEERNRRNRLLEEEDVRVRREPFVSAPFIHKNNEPKYHAMLLRAAEQAKTDLKYTLWFAAQDVPEDPTQIAKTRLKLPERLQRFLTFHDQQTAGLPGLNILYEACKLE